MKRLLSLFAAAAVAGLIATTTSAADFKSLIPRPAQMEQASGTTSLPSAPTIGYAASLPEAMRAECERFAAELSSTTGLKSGAVSGKGFFNVVLDPSISHEGYDLSVDSRGVTIAASDAAGLFYAFQTIKKLLPPNVMAGVEAPGEYILPVGKISDRPRYAYRGFMLDVSRHFFSANEIKKMLRLMAGYKLNRFHWHLTDDQGWRLPVEKYPKLTREGATNHNILHTDFSTGRMWHAGADSIYGPFAYTPEEVRDIVDYARKLHIEVIPEIDMPGHMVAAIHAYPEFSTDPESRLYNPDDKNFRDFDHMIWNRQGVSRDVLDVSNPAVMQFVKDVIDQVAEYFPYEYIHIGGDECPTVAWENSASCRDKIKELGLRNARQLQSWFTKEVADYAREKHGRKIMGWNELITEGDVDIDRIKEIDPVIFCWIGGEKEAESNGIRHVYTPINGGYYINRSYQGIDSIGAGRDGAIAKTLQINPPADHKNCIGVQGTFWTEFVERPADLEYLALPRLIGIAEQGWSSEREKNLDDFLSRLRDERLYLDLAGYNYGRHQIE